MRKVKRPADDDGTVEAKKVKCDEVEKSVEVEKKDAGEAEATNWWSIFILQLDLVQFIALYLLLTTGLNKLLLWHYVVRAMFAR